ncbi:MAG: glycine cleavage system protein GcvH [Candidatus Bathyarchaeia archaeon]
MKIEDYKVPEGLYYSKDHEWLKMESDVCRIGVTDYAQKSLHEVVFVDLPKCNINVTSKQALGTVESVKAVSDYFAPIGGKIIEVNDVLSNKPDLINTSPYNEGWIVVIKPENFEEIKMLMDSTKYAELLKSIIKD